MGSKVSKVLTIFIKCAIFNIIKQMNDSIDIKVRLSSEYYGAAEPPVRCGESHLSGLTEPLHFVY